MGDVLLVEAVEVDAEIEGSVGEYRAFLEGRGECEVVGRAGDEADCPVRNFLAGKHGEEEIFVEEYLVYKGPEVYGSQRWMDYHVRYVDRKEGAITAGRALVLLEMSEGERAEAERVVVGAARGAA